MKIYFYFFTFVIFALLTAKVSLISKTYEVEFTANYSDLNGILQNNENIISYGSNGILMKSSDWGNTWQQINFDKSYVFNKMANNGNEIWGINYDSILCHSLDFGKTFSFQNIKYSKKCNSIFFNNSKIFLLSDQGLEYINKQTMELVPIELKSNVIYKQMINVEDKLYICTNADNLIEYNITNNTFKEYTYNDTSNCDETRQISFDNNAIYFNRFNKKNKSYLYKFDLLSKNFEQLNDDLPLDNEYYGLMSVNRFAVNHDKILAFVSLGTQHPWSIEWKLNIFRLENRMFNFQQTYNDYYNTSYLNDVKFLNDSILILVGNNKAIYRSTDQGKTWDIRSNSILCRYTNTINFLNDTTISYFGAFNNMMTSTNSGVDFKSMKRKTNDISKDFKTTTIGQLKSSNQLIVLYGDPALNKINEFYTKDSLDYRLTDSMWGEINSRNGNFKMDIDKKENKYFIMYNYKSILHSNLITFDENFKYEKIVEFDSSLIIESKIKSKNDFDIVKLKIDKDKGIGLHGIKKIDLQFMSSTNAGLDWQVNKSFNIEDFIGAQEISASIVYLKNNAFLNINSYFVNDSDFTIINRGAIYKISNDNLEQIYYLESKENLNISNLKLVGDKLFFINESGMFILDPISKKLDTLFIQNNNVITDMLQYKNEWWGFVWNKQTKQQNFSKLKFPDKILNSIEENNIETAQTNNTYLYNYPPYPIPAKDVVNCTIHWDTRYDIKDAKLAVYNIFGEMIDNNPQNIYINASQAYEGTLTWDCKNQAAGVYLLSVKYGTIDKKIPVLIGR